MFFRIYARNTAIRLTPAWLDDQEVIAVFENGPAPRPNHVMWLDWRDGRIATIYDYRYAPYVAEGAEVTRPE